MLNFEALKFTLLIGSSFVDKLGFNYKTKTFAKTLHQVTKFVISLGTLCIKERRYWLGSSFWRKSWVKPQNEDLRLNVLPGAQIRHVDRCSFWGTLLECAMDDCTTKHSERYHVFCGLRKGLSKALRSVVYFFVLFTFLKSSHFERTSSVGVAAQLTYLRKSLMFSLFSLPLLPAM